MGLTPGLDLISNAHKNVKNAYFSKIKKNDMVSEFFFKLFAKQPCLYVEVDFSLNLGLTPGLGLISNAHKWANNAYFSKLKILSWSVIFYKTACETTVPIRRS